MISQEAAADLETRPAGLSKAWNRLTSRAVAAAKPGRYHDGRGLYLCVSKTGAKKWTFRFTRDGRPTEHGLGSAAIVGLAEARDKAHEARKLAASGVNPIVASRETKRRKAGKGSFGEIAVELIAAKAPEWRSAKHLEQWRATLTTYAAQGMGHAGR